LANLNRFQEAIECYKKTFEFEAPDALTYYNIGECYEQLEDMQRSREYYRKATKLDPNLSQAWLGIGVTLQNEERWFEALHYIKKALELDEDSAECWFALGDAEYHLDNYAAAEAAYQKVVQLEPENKDIWLEYSHLLMVDNRQAEAIELLENGLVYHPEDAELLYRMVCYHYSTGRIQEAYQLLEAALDKNVDLCHTLFEYAPSLEKDRNIVELIDLYKKRL